MTSDLESRYIRTPNDELLAIVHSHSFRPDAQNLVKEVLLQRGMSEDDINQWRDPDAELAAPRWCVGMSGAELKRMFRWRKWLDRIIFFLPVSLQILNLLTNPSVLGFIIRFIFFWYFFLFYLLWIRPILHTIFFWHTPLRILLLRPFDFPPSRKCTRRFAKHYLRYLGHTYTISDVQVRPRWGFLESLQFLLAFTTSLWFFWAFRSSFEVRWNEDIPRLKNFLSRRLVRNMAWVFSWDKIFKVSCRPETWRHTVRQLINSAQVIVVDLSCVGEGLRWELDEIQFYEAEDKLVFVCHEGNLGSAQSFLASYGMSESGEVFAYRDSGRALRQKELNEALVSVAARPVIINKPFRPAAS